MRRFCTIVLKPLCCCRSMPGGMTISILCLRVCLLGSTAQCRSLSELHGEFTFVLVHSVVPGKSKRKLDLDTADVSDNSLPDSPMSSSSSDTSQPTDSSVAD